ncbi:MAG: hypothetical protein IRD7MM_01750 [Candidatus Midichloria mitochondrii]|uniref:Uncharacterized protein n=1 Tax=Midichloria mitochondrii (strain IricVA) TaxID=696127 RepID=F7XUN7_MIDMI|nr:hypothetical protein [Candidatus Midichloria mitochondrii]AEI88386.1 hypothetical protein midi_00060 [Candidatus Midichloria mitochondrii IricVA]MDJ1256968.1 hypothetical protein [Candidatus Midichloria mitochondrii]MDJ1288718.1 hypothetical protein [Candidatus Midichloria mitochondrii]MDJ1299546.1 hypothetical protein [Candidatus Midichloria mitochondrii]MDJ1313392.1 hypothetical protein [Candidatus Midichloria mitochondrii]
MTFKTLAELNIQLNNIGNHNFNNEKEAIHKLMKEIKLSEAQLHIIPRKSRNLCRGNQDIKYSRG